MPWNLPGEFRLECEPIYHRPTTSQQTGYNNNTIINLPHGYYRRLYLYLYVSTITEQATTGYGRYDVASLNYSVLLRSMIATTWAKPVATPSSSSAWIPFRAVDPGLGCLAARPACLPASLQTIFRRSGSTKRLNSWYDHIPHRGSYNVAVFLFPPWSRLQLAESHEGNEYDTDPLSTFPPSQSLFSL